MESTRAVARRPFTTCHCRSVFRSWESNSPPMHQADSEIAPATPKANPIIKARLVAEAVRA